MACFQAFHADAELVSAFQAGEGGWQMGTFGAGHLTGSKDLQLVIPYRDLTGTWYLDAFTYTGQRLPGFPYYAGGDAINVSPTLYDLDHDGKDEILFTRGNSVIALRGDGSILWSNQVNAANYVPNGGYQTVTNGFYWSATGAFLGHLPNTAVFSSEVSSPMVADLGTGTNEIITAWKIQPDPVNGAQDYNPFINQIYGGAVWGTVGETWSGGVALMDAATGKQHFVYHIHQLLEAGLGIGHPSPGRALHLYALNDSDSVVAFDRTQPFGLWGKGMLYKQFGKAQRLMCGSYQVPIDVYAADIDGDGRDECLVAGTQLSSLWQPNETVLDDDGAILWRRWLPQTNFINTAGWLNPSSLIPVNPDHDNHVDVLGFNDSYEITFRYWNGAELVDRSGWPKNFYPFLPTLPVVGDVDGDRQEEIVIGTYDATGAGLAGSLQVYALDGTLKLSIPVLGGVKQVPAIADVEGTGRLDVIYRSTLGQVYVQNFGSTSTNGLSWATHRGNMHRDANLGISLFPSGTPLVTQKSSGYNRASFSWSNTVPAQCYRIYRADRAEGPFAPVATVLPQVNSYVDDGLRPGWLYFYEVRAVYATDTVASSPFAVLSLLNSNLLANAGFEENDNSHWDKWFSGNIPMTDMSETTNVALHGLESMEILLQNQGNNSTIAQFDQYGIPDSTLYVTPGTFYSFGGYLKSLGISQPSQHWLTWISSKTGYDTNNRPALPYPYYFTPYVSLGTNATGWTYMNRTFQMPAGFPNVELGHSYSISAAGSGAFCLDDLFFRQIPAPSSTNWTALVPFGSSWKYFTNVPPADWTSAAFNDAPWLSGQAKFGAGSGPTNIVTRLAQFRPNYYFRKRFVLTNRHVQELLLSATCTDVSTNALLPLTVYLNGTLINTIVDTVTSQGNETRYFDLTPFAGLLVSGTNTLAVQLGNWSSDYDDVAFDVSLKAALYQPTGAFLAATAPANGTVTLTATTPAGTIWNLQVSDGSLGNWRTFATFTNNAGGIQTFYDRGAAGRTPPGADGSRFYRLSPF